MSKLGVIRSTVFQNRKIVVVHMVNMVSIPERTGQWSHRVEFILALRDPLYDRESLQNFFLELIRSFGFSPVHRDNFMSRNSALEVGRAYYNEIIGEETIERKIILFDQELFSIKGLRDGEKVIWRKRKLERRILVRLYPDENLAKDAANGLYECRIPYSVLGME